MSPASPAQPWSPSVSNASCCLGAGELTEAQALSLVYAGNESRPSGLLIGAVLYKPLLVGALEVEVQLFLERAIMKK